MVSEVEGKVQKARKGFTLVELLIVIIIIGILAGAMMLVAGTSRDSAEASRIISDLRNMKAAALMWMADNPTTVTGDEWVALDGTPDPINRYLDRPLIADQHPFIFVDVYWDADTATSPTYQAGEVWLLGYNLSDVRDGVKSRLADQASSAGLFKISGISASGKTDNGGPLTLDENSFYTSGEDYIFVVVQ